MIYKTLKFKKINYRSKIITAFSSALILGLFVKASCLIAFSFGDSGIYLAANTAKFSSDYLAASKLHNSLRQKDPTNIDYTVDAVIFSVAAGNVDDAVQIVQQAQLYGLESPLFGLVLIVH